MSDSWTLIEYWGKSSPTDDDVVVVGTTTERQVSGKILNKCQESEVEPYRGLVRCILAIFQKYAIFAQF